MGWIAGSYGITTNIGLITTIVDNVTIEILNNKLTAVGLKSISSSSGYNTSAGTGALASNSSGDNSAFGYNALNANTTGIANTAVGTGALATNISGTENVGIGYAALNKATGSNNTGIGSSVLFNSTSPSNNTAVGYEASYSLTTGYNNTVIGSQAGYSATTGYYNVFIGYQAGYNETGNQLLYIANSNTATPLIYGNFALSSIKINGYFQALGIQESVTTPTLTSGTYHLLPTDSYLAGNASAGLVKYYLPSATGSGQKYVVIKTDTSTNEVVVFPVGSDTIEGSTSKALTAQYDKIAVVDIASGLWADLGTGGGI